MNIRNFNELCFTKLVILRGLIKLRKKCGSADFPAFLGPPLNNCIIMVCKNCLDELQFFFIFHLI